MRRAGDKPGRPGGRRAVAVPRGRVGVAPIPALHAFCMWRLGCGASAVPPRAAPRRPGAGSVHDEDTSGTPKPVAACGSSCVCRHERARGIGVTPPPCARRVSRTVVVGGRASCVALSLVWGGWGCGRVCACSASSSHPLTRGPVVVVFGHDAACSVPRAVCARLCAVHANSRINHPPNAPLAPRGVAELAASVAARSCGVALPCLPVGGVFVCMRARACQRCERR